jgi:flagellar hook-length control protein FliK
MKSSATALVPITAAPAKGARTGTAAAAAAGDFLRLIGADTLAAKKAGTARGSAAETSLPAPGARPGAGTGEANRAVKAGKAQPADPAEESAADPATPICENPAAEAGLLDAGPGENHPTVKPARSAPENGDAARAGSPALRTKPHPQEPVPVPGARTPGDTTAADARAAIRAPRAIPPTTQAGAAKLENSLAALTAAAHEADSAVTPVDDAAIRALTRVAERGAPSAAGPTQAAASNDPAMRPADAVRRAAKAETDTVSSSSVVLPSLVRTTGRGTASAVHPNPSNADSLARRPVPADRNTIKAETLAASADKPLIRSPADAAGRINGNAYDSAISAGESEAKAKTEARMATSAGLGAGAVLVRSAAPSAVEPKAASAEIVAPPVSTRTLASGDTHVPTHAPGSGKATDAGLRTTAAAALNRSPLSPIGAAAGSAGRHAADDTARIDPARANIHIETVGNGIVSEPRLGELRVVLAAARRVAPGVERTAGSSDEAAPARDAHPPASTATADDKRAAGRGSRAAAASRDVTAVDTAPAGSLRKAGTDAIAAGKPALSESHTAETPPAAATSLATTTLAAGTDGEIRAPKAKAARAEARADAREAAASDKPLSATSERTQPTAAALDRTARDADKPASAVRIDSGAVDVSLPAAHTGHDAHLPVQNGGRIADTWASPVRDAAFQAAAPAVTIRVHASNGAMRAIEIRLDPPELGTVDVRLETGRDGRLKAVLQADNVQALELLKREAGTLEAALRDAGVTLSEEGLSFTLNDSGGNSGAAHQRERSYSGASARHDKSIEDDAIVAASRRDGSVDISV